MSDTKVLWSYPFIFHRVRRVDAKYAYLVVKDGFVPLRRREGVLSVLWRYDVFLGKQMKESLIEDLYYEVLTNLPAVLSDYDEVSTFFQTKLEEEYAEEIENETDVSRYGKLWDEKFKEMYGEHRSIRHNILVKSTVMYV